MLPVIRIRTAFAVATAVLTALSGTRRARAQTPGGRESPTRVDLSGPFVQFGGLVGSSSGESGPVEKSDNGYGWSFGAGIGIHRHLAAVGNYAMLQVKPIAAEQSYDLEQRELGVRLRFGGTDSPALFFVEGGGALRRAWRATSDVFGNTPPSGADSTVRISGVAAWFGPGIQYFMGRRLGAEVTAAWAWGDLDTAHIQGDELELAQPIGIITLRLRAAVVIALF